MTSQAVYCLSLQIRPPTDDNGPDGNGSDPSRAGSSTSLDKMQSDSIELTSTATTSSQQTATHRLTTQPTSNIYLVRGARTENGQIILQNSHDLLSLLNSDDDKPILVQHQRIKTENGPDSNSAGTILFQPTLKATTLSDSPIILQTQAPLKKNSNDGTSTGQIFLQQRLNKNGTADGPILLQTLKRLDKSQPILVFRSTASNNHTTTSTTTKSNLKQIIGGNDDGDESVQRKEHNHQLQHKQGNIPLGSDGEPIKLPENLESLPRADHFPIQRHRWNTNEEIAAILISFDKHSEWQSKEVKTRPKSGSMLLYSRKKVRYRRDGYCWKKRKDGKTTREDHMKLKVQGTECIYGCYVHSAILPTFHRRCYWLLQNPDIVLVHYLNVPYPDDNKMAVITPSLSLWGDKKEWTKEELVSQLKPMFFSEDEPDSNNEIEISTAETVEAIVAQLMEKQRLARQAALVKQLECGCPDSTCADGKSCSHPMRRITAAKTNNDNKRNETVNQSSNQVTSTTPNVLIGQRIYPRWLERRGGRGGGGGNNNNNNQVSIIGTDHSTIQDLSHSSLSTTTSSNSITTITTTPKSLESSIHFQVIPTTSHSNMSNQNSNNLIRSNSNNSNNSNSLINNNNNISNNQPTNGNNSNNNNNNQLNRNNNQLTTVQVSHSNQLNLNTVGNNGGRDKNVNNNNNNNNLLQQNDNANSNGANSMIDNQRTTQNLINNANSRSLTVNSNVSSASIVTSAPPLVLSLSQIQGHGSLLILNGQQQSFVCQPQQHNAHHAQLHHQQQQHHHIHQQQQQQQQLQRRNSSNTTTITNNNNKNDDNNKLLMNNNNNNNQTSHLLTSNLVVPKQEAMDSSSSSSEKQMDNVYDSMSYSSTQQNTPIDSPLKENSAKDFHDSLQFFNETLDLSQEDIQKTLSANMPIGNHHQHQQHQQQHHHNPHQQQQQHHQMQHQQHHLNNLNSQQHDSGHHNTNNINNNHHGQHQHHHDDTIGGEINPMDFIDNCDVVGVENVHGNDDDFVNLDAFDMLVEFPELELDGIKNGFLQSTDSIDSHLKKSTDNTINLHGTNEVFNISDYSPEWAYPEGGVKVLVTGPWNSESSYTVLFDSFPVPTTIVQSGVLRCYCPAHEVGLATLQVACDGYVISNSVMFEYKSPPKSEYSSESNSNEALFKFSLIDRFESINDRLKIKTEPGESSEEMTLFTQSNFEDRMVSLCHSLRTKSWRHGMTNNTWTTSHRGMTLLHFASALGYSKLVCTMLTWRNENTNVLLEAEIDALSQDYEGFTPLMWACAKGHTETAVMLYRWNSNALNVKNNCHQSAIEIAKKYGYSELINEIERLEIQHKYNNNNISNSIIINNSNPPPLTSISSNSNTNTIIFTSNANPILSSNSLTLSNQSIINSNNIFTYDNISNNSNFYNINTSNNLSTVFTTVSSALSSLTSSNNNTHIKILSQNINNNNNNNNNNISIENSNHNNNNNNNNNNSNLNSSSQCASPASVGSVNSLKSSRSHDGVFLRPGAVSSALSPPGNNNNSSINNNNSGNSNANVSNARLSKRPSVDSGINVDIRSAASTLSRQSGGTLNLNNGNGKGIRDQLKLSRFDRSMSLPITNTSPLSFSNSLDSGDSFSLSIDSSMEGSNNNSNTSSLLNSNCLASPLRKMDFALCEVSASDSSPIGNQQTASDDDDELCRHQEGDNIAIQDGGGVVGESDAKVLTLAEQIIAAMPDRIKNESEELMSLGSPITQETLSGDTSVMSGLNDTFMEPLLDSMSNSHFDQEFNFEFGDQNYRYHDVGTPCSSLSPASSGPLQSPASYSITAEPPMGSPSPPPTTQDFTEFLHASNSTLKPFEADFSNLTLTDREQRELYEAAKCIQKAYRSYKGRKKLEEQDKERTAAIVIQNYYRRYKQYAYYRQMTHAALVIQNKFRSYCENKRFKKSQNLTGLCNDNATTQQSSSSSNTQFQNFYKNYQNEQHTQGGGSSGQTSKEPSPSGPLKRTYSQRTQNQAARKIQQFMRQSKLKLQRERAEKERLVHQHRAEYLQSLQYQQGHQEVVSRDPSENIHQSLQQQQQQQQRQQQIFHTPSSSQIPTNPNNNGQQHYWN